jgi:hypothetical protein
MRRWVAATVWTMATAVWRMAAVAKRPHTVARFPSAVDGTVGFIVIQPDAHAVVVSISVSVN